MNSDDQAPTWPVTMQGRPFQLELGPETLSLRDGGEMVRAWSRGENDVTFPSAYSIAITTATGEVFNLGFASTRAQSEFRTSFQGRCATPVIAQAKPAPPRYVQHVPQEQRTQSDAQARLVYFIVFGVLLELVGGLIIGAAWSDSVRGALAEDVNNGGAEAAFIAGLLLASIGSSFFLVGLVGFAVKYGVLAARATH